MLTSNGIDHIRDNTVVDNSILRQVRLIRYNICYNKNDDIVSKLTVQLYLLGHLAKSVMDKL